MTLRVLAVCLLFVLPASAAAQGRSSVFGRVVFVGETPWTVVERWTPRGGSIELRGPSGVSRGELPSPGWLAAAARDDGILVAIASSGPAAVRTAWIPITDGRAGTPRPMTVPRMAGEGFAPVGVSIARRPDGFAVIWQEGSTTDPSATWQTYEARLGPHGEALGSPRAFAQVPWPIADALYTSGATFLLLYYGTNDPQRTRLCAVHIDENGAPREHPWWASREGLIGEAHLVERAGRVLAVYRGGRDGDVLLEADVTNGGWAQEAPEPRAHGPIDAVEAYGERVVGGELRIHRAGLRDPG